MAVVEKSVVVPAPLEKAWAAVSDFRNWEEMTATHLTLSIKKVRFELLDAPGPGARFTVRVGRNALQGGVIQAWEPPRLLVARAVTVKRGFEQAEVLMAVALEPQDEANTEVALRLELDFTHPRLGSLVSALFPLQSSIDRWAAGVCERLREMLARA